MQNVNPFSNRFYINLQKFFPKFPKASIRSGFLQKFRILGRGMCVPLYSVFRLNGDCRAKSVPNTASRVQCGFSYAEESGVYV